MKEAKPIKTALNYNKTDKIKSREDIHIHRVDMEEYSKPMIMITAITTIGTERFLSDLVFNADKKSLTEIIKRLESIKKTLES